MRDEAWGAMSRTMTAILYPVAETAEAALHAPLGFAARAGEAEGLSSGPVVFATEMVGPAFPTREAALAAYAGSNPGRGQSGARMEARVDEGHGVRLVPVAAADAVRPQAPVRPSYSGGRRWPAPSAEPAFFWRLSVSFWRMGGDAAVETPAGEARRLRRDDAAKDLTPPALNALARQPLRAFRPQQPLDIGLFEMRPPEAPDTLIPDE